MSGHLPNLDLIAFTDDELLSLQRLLLPKRMAHHDKPAEVKLRAGVERAKTRRGQRTLD